MFSHACQSDKTRLQKRLLPGLKGHLLGLRHRQPVKVCQWRASIGVLSTPTDGDEKDKQSAIMTPTVL